MKRHGMTSAVTQRPITATQACIFLGYAAETLWQLEQEVRGAGELADTIMELSAKVAKLKSPA